MQPRARAYIENSGGIHLGVVVVRDYVQYRYYKRELRRLPGVAVVQMVVGLLESNGLARRWWILNSLDFARRSCIFDRCFFFSSCCRSAKESYRFRYFGDLFF